MVLIFSEPFSSRLGGRDFHVELEGPIPLRELLARLPAEVLQAVVGGEPGSEDAILARVLFFRDGRLIRWEEPVANSDTINVLLAATGG
jgi:hypothetical protein